MRSNALTLHFIFDPDTLTLTCPNGVTATKFSDEPEGKAGRTFRFSAKQCHGCPLWNQCRSPKAKPTSRRTVFVSDYRDYNLDALAYNKTDTFKHELKLRPVVERIIFNLTHYHGARRAKTTGKHKANFQLQMNAMAFNIRQLLRRWPKLNHDTAAA